MSPEKNRTSVPAMDKATSPRQPIVDMTATNTQLITEKPISNHPSDANMTGADQATITLPRPWATNKCMPISVQNAQAEATSTDCQYGILEQVEARLMRGENKLTIDEQTALYNCMDKIDKIQGDILAGVATLICNRTDALSFKLAEWFYRNGNNTFVRKLLKERVKDMEGACGDLMVLEDVDMLMDCQTVLEKLEEEGNID